MTQFDPAHVDRGGPPHRYAGGPLEVTKLHVGPYENNAYLLRDPETNDALLVDAANEAERLLELLEGVTLAGIVTAHRHPDHIQALAGVLKVHDVWNGAHGADADAIADQVGVTLTGCWSTATPSPWAATRSPSCTPPATPRAASRQAAVQPGPDRRRPVPGRVGKTEALTPSPRRSARPSGPAVAALETRISPGHGDDTLVEREVPQLDEWKARGW